MPAAQYTLDRTTTSFLQAFTDHYYQTFDTNRPTLAGLYQDQSMLTFEGQKYQGTQLVSWRQFTPQGSLIRIHFTLKPHSKYTQC